MSTDWQNFITMRKLYTVTDPLAGEVLCYLDTLGVLQISGAEVEKFLQSQLTYDVNALTPQTHTLAAWCSAQGRVLALPCVLRDDNDFLLILPKDLLAETQKRLQMFVLRLQVSIRDVSEQYLLAGISSAQSHAVLQTFFNPLPEVGMLTRSEAGMLMQLYYGAQPQQYFLALLKVAGAVKFWQTLATHTQECNAAVWQREEILAAQPRVVHATRDKFIPQTLNLDALGAISFTKGCYPGQEVVARLKYRGRVKQRLFAGTAPASGPVPELGARLAIASESRSVGEIVSVLSVGEKLVLTAVVDTDTHNQTVHIETTEGAAIQFLPLPYPVE